MARGIERARLTHDGRVVSIAFNSDGSRLATASEDQTARLVDIATGQETARLRHDGNVSVVAFSPDGRFLATASEDKFVQL